MEIINGELVSIHIQVIIGTICLIATVVCIPLHYITEYLYEKDLEKKIAENERIRKEKELKNESKKETR